MDPMKTAKTMQDFERQSARMEMTEEMSKFRIYQEYHQLENNVDSIFLWTITQQVFSHFFPLSKSCLSSQLFCCLPPIVLLLLS